MATKLNKHKDLASTRNGEHVALDGVRILLANLVEEPDTLYKVHQRSGLPYMTVYNFAHGRTGRLDMRVLAALCGAMNCQPGDLLKLS